LYLQFHDERRTSADRCGILSAGPENTTIEMEVVGVSDIVFRAEREAKVAAENRYIEAVS
jgi:hypothetical protein